MRARYFHIERERKGAKGFFFTQPPPPPRLQLVYDRNETEVRSEIARPPVFFFPGPVWHCPALERSEMKALEWMNGIE